MDAIERTVRLYVTEFGECPFENWFDGLGDIRAQDRILAGIARLRVGNPGDWKSVGSGIFEMRIDYGPGYRLYFGQEGYRLVILLIGGDKRTQERDVKRAKDYWNDYKEAKVAKDF